jgi:hypothetical protein
MKTAIAIGPMMRNVLSVAKIPPAAMTASQMARTAPRIVPMIRPMSPVCARGFGRDGACPQVDSPADASRVMISGPPGPARTFWPGPVAAPKIAVRLIAPTADAARRMRERGLVGLQEAAGAWRRDGCVVLPGCLGGPALQAARRDFAAVFPGVGEYTPPGRGATGSMPMMSPGDHRLALPAAALRRVVGHGTSAARIAIAAGNAPAEISSVWRSAIGRNYRLPT